MASTPSASALSAVLRCQGNILARKQASNKRPPSAAAVYGLGTTCGDAFKSYFRSLWGFIFHRERVEIPGVLSVTARIETSCLGKPSIRYGGSDHLTKNSVVTGNKVANQWSKTSLKCKPKLFSGLSQNNLVLRLTYLRKLNFEHPWTCCLCVVCVENKSSLKHGKMDSLFSLGLLWFLKDELIHLTTAVSGCLRTHLGIDWNQIHPDCDELTGCVKCASEHQHEDQRPLEGAESGD